VRFKLSRDGLCTSPLGGFVGGARSAFSGFVSLPFSLGSRHPSGVLPVG